VNRQLLDDGVTPAPHRYAADPVTPKMVVRAMTVTPLSSEVDHFCKISGQPQQHLGSDDFRPQISLKESSLI
jgi:hypothetical protein